MYTLFFSEAALGDFNFVFQPAAVKKAYRRAALVCHPDKHTGGEHEKLARAIFMQLAESYTKFEENPSM